MYMSKMFLTTLREAPNEAEIVSHKLMLRAGLVRALASGIYNYLPMGIRVLDKIENIVREEMNRKGALQILCTALQPRELWDESGRWDDYGRGMFKLKDRNEREYCLGPTHEEVFVNIVKKEVNSYKQLPLNLYQIQSKYRDEARPRFGLLRTREFIMKDAYSFDIDEAGLDKSYNDMYDAYSRVFDRCGVNWRAVLADTGAIGGSGSHQFMALSEIGESDILYCPKCNYAADREKAEFMLDKTDNTEEKRAFEKVNTPGSKTIEEVSTLLNEPSTKFAKSMLFKVDGRLVLIVIRGDREINKVKFCNAVGVAEDAYDEHVQMASEEDIERIGSTAGFIGPVGLKEVEIIVDREIEHMVNFFTGANEKDYHLKNVNYGRDFSGRVRDVSSASEGDKCPQCGEPMAMERGIEVGQIFKLGTKYSKPMDCTYLNEQGESKPMVMGCYGIGVTRTLSAVLEQHHDENGIIWPISLAPFHVVITVVNINDQTQFELAKKMYDTLQSSGIETLLDDRDERAGVKFKDADLIGIPVRITVGKKASEGIVEFKERKNAQNEEVDVENAVNKSIELIREGLKY